MRKNLVIGAVLLTCSVLAFYAGGGDGLPQPWKSNKREVVQNHQEQKPIIQYVVQQPEARPPQEELEARIIDLPNDGDAWHTTLFVHPDWKQRPSDRRLVAAFESEPRLMSVKTQTMFHVYTTDGPDYRERFAQFVPVVPAVLVQRGADGKVIYKKSGPNVADDERKLAREVKDAIKDWCDRNRCYPIHPKPLPDTQPQPLPVEPIPDTMLQPPADKKDNSGLVALLGILTAGGAGVATQLRKGG